MTNLSDISAEAIYLPTCLPTPSPKRSVFTRERGEVDKKLRVRGDDGAEGETKKRAKLWVTEQQEHTYFRVGVGR